MRLPEFSFHEPLTLDQAFATIKKNNGNTRFLAGGTDLVPLMKFGLETPSMIVSLKKIEGLKGLAEDNGYAMIGALTTLREIISSTVISGKLPALSEAAMAVAAPPVWNVATLGGNIRQQTRCVYYNQSRAWRLEKEPCFKAGGNVCHAVPRGKKCFSVYCGDIAPALIALDAAATISGMAGPAEVRLIDLFSNDGLSPFTLEKNTIITGIKIPVPGAASRSGYAKLRVRSAIDYPLVSAAASVALDKDSIITGVKLALSAVGPAPVAIDLNGVLVGVRIDTADFTALKDVLPKKTQIADNLALPGSYRRKMLSVIAKKAIMKAAERAAEKETI